MCDTALNVGYQSTTECTPPTHTHPLTGTTSLRWWRHELIISPPCNKAGNCCKKCPFELLESIKLLTNLSSHYRIAVKFTLPDKVTDTLPLLRALIQSPSQARWDRQGEKRRRRTLGRRTHFCEFKCNTRP